MTERDLRGSAVTSTDISDFKDVLDDESESGYISAPLTSELRTEILEDADNLSKPLASVHLETEETEIVDVSTLHWSKFFIGDEDGDTHLHIAACNGCEKIVTFIVKACPSPNPLNVQNDQAQTPLHMAVAGGYHKIVRTLIEAGARMDVRDWLGETPLHKATVFGDKNCLRALLAPVSGKKPHVTSKALNQKNYNGQTSLHIAAIAGNLELVKELVFYGADINAREGLGGYTALHLAAEGGNKELAQYLLRHPGTVIAERNYAGKTARQLAMRTGAREVFARVPLHDDEDYYPSSDEEYDEDDDEESSLDTFLMLKASLEQSIPVL